MDARGPLEVISELFIRVPGFAALRRDHENDLPYEVFGELALELLDEDSALSSEDVQSAFSYFNDMAISPSVDERNLLVVGVLEILCDARRGRELARELLRGEALGLFERTRRGWPDDISEQ